MEKSDNKLTLLTDFYQISMMNGYFLRKTSRREAVFDLFFRKNPFNGGYCIFAGLENILDFLENLRFSKEDIDYLANLKMFSSEFLDWLKEFRFTGSVFSVQEGSVVFPNEPLVRVSGPLIEAQFLETFFLNALNFQTLIATKAARIYEASGRGSVIEFGLRRAQGSDGAISATRASFIGGCEGTSNTFAAMKLGIPVRGTMAHSWVMAFQDELSAFKAYSEVYPDSSILLVDTFDSLKDGIPHAIKIAKELAANGKKLRGIRLDSGDLAFLSCEARKMLDEAGLYDVKIVASNDLDEWIIESLRHQGAKIDSWGVGTKLVTGGGDSALGGVYKLAAIEDEQGTLQPKIKISQNIEKTTIPGRKMVYRIFSDNAEMLADVLALDDEDFPGNLPLQIHHPLVEYKFTRIEKVVSFQPLLKEVFSKGRRTNPPENLKDIQERAKSQLQSLHPSHRRLANPHTYKVGLTPRLWALRQKMIDEALRKN